MKLFAILAAAAIVVASSLFAFPAYAADDTAANLITSVGTPLLAVVVPLVIAFIKSKLPMLPTWSIPMLAPLLGAGGDALMALLAGLPVTGWKGAAAGLAGIGIREIVDQTRQALPPGRPPGA